MLQAGPGDVLVVDAKGYLEAGPRRDACPPISMLLS
jgi:hypothetical protein